MYTRILVPLDGSPLAEQVLPYVRVVAKSLGTPVELLRAFSPPSARLADPQRGHYLHQVESGIHGEMMDYLNEIKSSMGDLKGPVTCRVEEGDPATWIVNDAEKEPGTLIAMATHGRSGVRRWFLGSVTAKVLHASDSPMLIARSNEDQAPSPETNLKTVIVPLDGSELAEQILPQIIPMVKALHMKVLLARCTPSAEEYHSYLDRYPLGTSASVYTGPYEVFAKEADARAMDYLHEVRQKLQKQHVFSVEEKLLRGQAAGAIVDFAQETEDNLVAMTTHGRSGIGRWVLGSVTDRVVRHSGDPVLVVRAKH